MTADELPSTAAFAVQPAPPSSPSLSVAAWAVRSDVLPLPGELRTAPASTVVGHAASAAPVSVP
jgi:hypothetical protein